MKPRLPSLSCRGDLTGHLEKDWHSQSVLTSLGPRKHTSSHVCLRPGFVPPAAASRPGTQMGGDIDKTAEPSFPGPGEKLWLLEGDLK